MRIASRLVSVVVTSLFALPLVLAGCGDDPDEEEAFATLQACYDDHHEGDEGLPIQEAIVTCCLEHPIAGQAPSCGDTSAACVTHVTAELDGIQAADVQAACDEYIDQR